MLERRYFVRFHYRNKRRVTCVRHQNSEGEQDYGTVLADEDCVKCSFLSEIAKHGVFCKAPRRRGGNRA
jgi:hypothetical protein